MNIENNIALIAKFIIFAPLLSGLILCLLRKKVGYKWLAGGATVNMGLIAAATVWLLWVFQSGGINHLGRGGTVGRRGVGFLVELWSLLRIGEISANLVVYLDMASVLMLGVVSVVSFMVHLYSISYIEDDPGRVRFIGYLSLFTFSMLLLVTAADMFQLFIGWEGVGLMSYLLIGFWFEKDTAVAAAKKAFIVNRVSDVALLSGVIILLLHCRGIAFSQILAPGSIAQLKGIELFSICHKSVNLLDGVCLLLFIGCMGKSAQLLFHVWLPDAMEGPTPVSALIHAATMVTAGVFLVVRCAPLFANSPLISELILLVGISTALFAGTVALQQNDIKRIIAYSTCSQLGYMFAACGVSAFGAAMFHLATHAFFKALLFLGAGSVIHGIGGEQNIRKMGGLVKKMPYTYAMMLVGSGALAGIYPLAGFYSKDAILEAIYNSHSAWAGAAFTVGFIVAALTAVYSMRLLYHVFLMVPTRKLAAHEAGYGMKIAMGVLLVGAVLAGLVGNKLGMAAGSSKFWLGMLRGLPGGGAAAGAGQHGLPGYLTAGLFMVGGVSMFFTYLFYLWREWREARGVYCEWPWLCRVGEQGRQLLSNAYYFDCGYNVLLVAPFKRVAVWGRDQLERKVFDGFIRGLYAVFSKIAQWQSRAHSGYVNHYVAVAFVAVLLLVIYQGIVHVLIINK